MSDTLMGNNEAERRLRALVNQTNHGGVEYPSGTNERGYPGRERHAAGDRVVGDDDVESHAHGDRVGRKCGGEASAPGRGGSRMSSHFGEPQKGRETGHPRHMAVKQAHAENHRRGERVGREKHAFGDMAGMGNNSSPQVQAQRASNQAQSGAAREAIQGPENDVRSVQKKVQNQTGAPSQSFPQAQPLKRGGRSHHPHHHRHER